jgi:hypothetical protein
MLIRESQLTAHFYHLWHHLQKIVTFAVSTRMQVVVLAAYEREVNGSSGGLYTLHDVWERPPANNLPQTPHSVGAYGTGYVLCSLHSNAHIASQSTTVHMYLSDMLFSRAKYWNAVVQAR